ncbi:MAG: RNA 2',3'-cyclic phosphodiesterase [Archaeoglobus sp.]|nr:RNA 2',3'-cyclic phosphodiesterase [Archaeoglobus sp.]
MRLFVAVDLSDEIRGNISRLSKILKVKGVKTVERENIHLTLKFLGEVNESKKDRVIAALDEIEFKSFRINLKGVGFFPNATRMRVVWVGVEEGADELKALAYEVEDKMAELKFKKERRFVPHATIARIKRVDANVKAAMLERLKEFENQEFGEMMVTHFSLKKSTLTPSGPIYEDLKLFRAR